MDNPYVEGELEPGLKALLEKIQATKLAPVPNEEMMEIADGLGPGPLAAFAYALGSHLWMDDLGTYETTAELADESYDDIRGSLSDAGLGDHAALFIGSDGGGEESLLMVDEATPAGYGIYRFANDGMRYANGKDLIRVGLIGDLLRELTSAEDGLSDDLQAVLDSL
ncbi:MAG: hypothetical protein H6718_27785 [Polyangiaceae bacterium]|nr:hypothetical protein [Polyangiaceae bacterium]